MEDTAQRPSRRLFVSYARRDKETLQPVLDGLERLSVTVWADLRLKGGQSWWDEILAQIRDCDGMLVPISDSLLASEACTSERAYGKELRKPIIPILISMIGAQALPSDLSKLQIIDCTRPGVEAAFELAGAVNALGEPPPLPEPLPEPPAIPHSYRFDLADRFLAPSLNLDEQLDLVAKLRRLVARPDDREWAISVLERMQTRSDLYKEVDREISETLEAVRREEPKVFVPAGWYDDPSGRHQLRWFDRDWTSWAADEEVMVDDPLS